MSKFDDLEKLSELKKQGVLTQEEFDAQKKALLGQTTEISTDDNPTDSSEDLPCVFRCESCSYKGQMEYVKHRSGVSVVVWIIVGGIFAASHYFHGINPMKAGALRILALIAFFVLCFALNNETDVYKCPKCGHLKEIKLNSKQIKLLKKHKLYHKNPKEK